MRVAVIGPFYEVNVEFLGNAGIESAQQGEKLLMPMARIALGEHRASGDVERGKQGRRAVAHVIVGIPPVRLLHLSITRNGNLRHLLVRRSA